MSAAHRLGRNAGNLRTVPDSDDPNDFTLKSVEETVPSDDHLPVG